MPTIFATATAPGRAGVAVIRLSGPGSLGAAQMLGAAPRLDGRRVQMLRDRDGQVLDEALVLHFSAGRSFTGEEVVELQCHGSPAVQFALLDRLGALPGLRLAEPGEFTRRALDNGRLDLSQVEGLADLIEAETESQRKQALRVFQGELGAKATAWRAEMLSIHALFTAAIDFADEDIPDSVIAEASGKIATLIDALQAERSGADAAELVRQGFEVAIVGAPNLGKSTLLNRLAGRDAAITSAVAGTTRDVIEVKMQIGGLPVTLLDTAGLRDATDEIEKMGVALAKTRAENADLRVFLMSKDHPAPDWAGPHDITLRAKADLIAGDGPAISGKTGQGVEALLSQITQILSARTSGASTVIRARHRQAIDSALHDLSTARSLLAQDEDLAIVSEMILSAIRAMESLIGRIDVESVLGEIFSSFCVGK